MKMKLLSVMLAASMLKGSLTDTDQVMLQFRQKMEGKVLNIWCWNEEFQRYFNAYYPDVESVSTDKSTTTLKDGVTVKWTIDPTYDNTYQDRLDDALRAQADAAVDDKIDLFLFEPDCAWKYVSADADAAMPLSELGITADDLADQYPYTRNIVTDENGEQRAASWNAAPGLFAYRRSIAQDVLGTDDPGKVQAALSDWNKFHKAAARAKDKGYYMLSGYQDSFRVFSSNIDKPWVEGTTVTVDANIMAWIEQTKAFTDKGYHHKAAMWSERWMQDQGAEGRVFGFFYPTWGVNFMLGDTVDEACYGDWAVCQGPQPYFWGGTWIAAAQGTDNPTRVKDVIIKLTCTRDIMKAMAEDPYFREYTNTISGMREIADDPDFALAFLCGQNPYALFSETASAVDVSRVSAYDQECNEQIQNAFGEYFDGYIDMQTAKVRFETAIRKSCPEITEVVWPD